MKYALTLCLGLLAAGLAFGRDDSALSPDDFRKYHADLLRPEQWETAPWKSSLLEARTLAFKEKKPLLLWCMDAKPLGSV
jgi:hypothetical protein